MPLRSKYSSCSELGCWTSIKFLAFLTHLLHIPMDRTSIAFFEKSPPKIIGERPTASVQFDSEGESGWTAYFDDYTSSASSSSIASDAALCSDVASGSPQPQLLHPSLAEEDDDLVDTATSPVKLASTGE
ncbi:hypothetical protein QQ045_010312 [Rhodiola kirilowii]